VRIGRLETQLAELRNDAVLTNQRLTALRAQLDHLMAKLAGRSDSF
jgi:hypothetical protein